MIRPAQPDQLLGWMESLSDPIRLRLLRLLEGQELGVAELCDILQLPQSTVSRHLKLLGDQAWLKGRRRGTTRLYHLILEELAPPARRLWLLAREQTDDWPTVAQDQLRLERRLRDRALDSQAFFAGAASQWDKLRAELYGENFAIEAMLALLPGDHVVADLGCGTGKLAERLSPHVGQVIGIDNSAAMLKAARKRVGDLSNVDLRRGDLRSIPIEDGSCDAALLLLVLTYVPDPAGVLKDAARVLRPSGKLVIVDLLPHARDDFRRQMGQIASGFAPEQVTAMLIDVGLSPTVRPLPPEPAAKGPALFLATGVKSI